MLEGDIPSDTILDILMLKWANDVTDANNVEQLTALNVVVTSASSPSEYEFIDQSGPHG